MSCVRTAKKLREIDMRCLDSSEVALKDNTTFVGYDVILIELTSFDSPSWIRHFLFHSVLKSRQLRELMQNESRMLTKGMNS